MNNPIRDTSTRIEGKMHYKGESGVGRRGLRGASVLQAESSMRIFYRNVSWSVIKSKRFSFRVVRNA